MNYESDYSVYSQEKKDVTSHGVYESVNTIISAMRIEQWYKNIVLFVGIIFSLNLCNFVMLNKTIIAFSVFCVLSSSVYILNDIKDVDKDCFHPLKKNRAIPSGKLPISIAWILAGIFIYFSMGIATILGTQFFCVCLIYLIQNVLYTYWLKSIVVVDIVVISIGFVWRALAGTVVIGVETSPWLITCSFLLALFLALLKRKSEITRFGIGKEYRITLGSYSKQLTDRLLTITTALLLISYMLYTSTSQHRYIIATIPFAVIGIFRYLQVEIESTSSDIPALIMSDRLSQVNLLVWILTSLAALYNFPDLLMNLLFY